MFSVFITDDKFQFQSTLPRGERRMEPYDSFDDRIFQSTLPRGERLRALAEYIHPCRFQSTLPRGERRYCADILFTLFLFQSTLPRGERLIRSCQLIRFTLNFNPRSREGSDADAEALRDQYGISIHAPARGATRLFMM